MPISDERYLAFTTYRRNGDAVSTPVWVVPVSDGRIGFWTAMGTGSTERPVTVQPCDARGRTREGTSPLEGTAETVRSGRLFDEVRARVRQKYGLRSRVPGLLGRLTGRRTTGQAYADTVVLVRLDGAGGVAQAKSD
jgi:PPOX class probable F420-dependent enzyme